MIIAEKNITSEKSEIIYTSGKTGIKRTKEGKLIIYSESISVETHPKVLIDVFLRHFKDDSVEIIR